MIKIKHDDLCPCTRFYTQPYFCTCGAASCETDLNAGMKRFGDRLRDINRRAAIASQEKKG
ncbi:hypothetical protein [Rhizobium leucaenae]|uniref:hypothetical protein n=1 Tax=Rhizobium leucaenae TaxID=29450 RepID=UPI001615BD1B|nr:hypothetical protein [Rhizobium leucaenae]MBB6299963.1 hypothetical protein [Rhizobium leucaenae]